MRAIGNTGRVTIGRLFGRSDAGHKYRRRKCTFGMEVLESRQLLAASPVITEFMASNNGALGDGDGSSPDWIELHNAGDAAVDLAGYRLTDDSGDLDQWTFPSVMLETGGYLVVFASGQDADDYVDASGNLHTNFKLSAGGETLALVSPEGTVVSQFGTATSDYPPQARNVSYGVAQAATLINANSPSMVWVPLDDSVGAAWIEPGFDAAAHQFSAGTAAVGFESRPNDRTNFTAHIQTPLRTGSHAVYQRLEFDLDNASEINALNLRLKVDNGFVAYLNGVKVAEDNAPANPTWFSVAPNNSPRDSQAIEFSEFDLSEHAGLLVDGSNVLAMHGLNSSSDNSDMLLVTELIANQPIDQAPVGYLPLPTPGGPNFVLDAVTGPLITDVTENVGALRGDQDVVVTARLQPQNGPVESATLVYRVMYNGEVRSPMLDDGLGADVAAGDGIYTATIPHLASEPGDMLRWRVTAGDANANLSRAPLFLDQEGTKQSPEYYGTVVADPDITGELPIFQWFTDDVRGAHSRGGARISVFYAGQFYDNAFARERGGATNGTDSQKLVFNRGHELLVNDQLGQVREININGPGSDSSYIRQTLAHQAYTAAGSESSASFLMNVQLNGDFDRVGVFIEHVDEVFAQRQGLDPNGSIYKFVQRNNLNPVFFDTVTGVEKKTPLDESAEPLALANGQQVTEFKELAARQQDVSEVQQIVDGLKLPTAEEKKQFLFDNLDIPQVVNYLALRSVTMDADDVRKNFYMYRDTFGTGEWSIFPWDKDWTFGVEGDGAPHLRNPFFGDQEHAKSNANQWNMLYDVLFDEPATRAMFLRRLRSVMDEFLGPPGTPAGQSYYQQQAQQLFDAAESLLPNNATSTFNSMMREGRTGYFDRRREDLYEDHSINNPGFRNNAGIPDQQAGNPTIVFGQIEFDPASGNQDEEFIELVNQNLAAVDISGWSLDGGVQFTFNPGTVIPALGSLYVTPNVNVFRARTEGPSGGQGRFVQGGYDGHLARDGETISLVAVDGSIVRRVSVGGVPSPVEQFLRITELNYQPHAPNPIVGLGEVDDGTPTAADRFEFLELTNTGDQVLDLAGVQFTAGVEFTFANGTTLRPGQVVLVVKDQAALESRYGTGLNIAGQFAGTLADDGESIFLDSASSRAIQSFVYRADRQWPQRAAGRGSSLEVLDPSGSQDSPDSWIASTLFGGSPGRAQSPVTDTVVVREVLSFSDSPAGDKIELHNAGGAAIDISNWYLSNSQQDYFKFRVPSGTVIAGLGYQAFDQNQFGFDLDRARGDDVWVIAADTDGRPLRFVDHAQFGASGLGISLGPWPTSADPWVMLAESTFGGTNSGPYVGEVAISELYYSPVDPDRAGRMVPDDVEFIELYNRSDTTMDISQWQLQGEVEFVFPAGTAVGAGQTLLVVGFDPSNQSQTSIFRFTLAANPSARLVGPFSPALNDEGGSLRLIRPETPPADDPSFTPWIPMDDVNYSSDPPWPGTAAGGGDSLHRTQPTDYGKFPTSWTSKIPSPGTAEFVSRRAGDANEDGQFDQLDLVQVLQADKFLTGQSASWSEGDWNGDQLFDPLDLVLALQAENRVVLQQNADRAVPASAGEIDAETVDTVDAMFEQL